jgi:hypothetical protein
MSHEHDWPEVPPLAADEFAMPAVIVCRNCGASRTIPGTNRPRNPATWPIPPHP